MYACLFLRVNKSVFPSSFFFLFQIASLYFMSLFILLFVFSPHKPSPWERHEWLKSCPFFEVLFLYSQVHIRLRISTHESAPVTKTATPSVCVPLSSCTHRDRTVGFEIFLGKALRCTYAHGHFFFFLCMSVNDIFLKLSTIPCIEFILLLLVLLIILLEALRQPQGNWTNP